MASYGVISLGEAGNLGDDLILLAVVSTLDRVDPGCAIRFVSGGRSLDWSWLTSQLKMTRAPVAVQPSKDLPFSSRDFRIFADCDAVVFGGGGLLQTSHHPNRPYHWLRYLPAAGPTPAAAIGLGVGPLSTSWEQRLRRLGSPFNRCYVRDEESLQLLSTEVGWAATLCQDFVQPTLINQLLADHDSSAVQQPSLGVALRAWPGLDADSVARHVSRVAEAHSLGEVRYFVLERSEVDQRFTEEVRASVNLVSSTQIYDSSAVSDFLQSMLTCTVAVSMKLHSSAVWAACETPIYPIIYAPKIASFFGLPYEGLKIIGHQVAPREQQGIPATEALADWIQSLPSPSNVSPPRRLGRLTRVRFQVENLIRYGLMRMSQMTSRRTGRESIPQ